MNRLKKLLPRQMLGYFRFFYGYLGNSILIAMGASMMVAILDGIGLTLFLPLLKVTDTASGPVDAGAEMGEMDIVVDAIEKLGINLTLTSVLALMLLFFTMKGVAKFCADYYTVILRQKFVNKVRLHNMTLLAGYDYRAFSRADSGRIQNTFSGEVGRLNNSYRSFFTMLQQAIMASVYVGLAYFANPKFAVIVAVGGALSNLLFSRLYKITKEASREVTTQTHAFQGFLIQSVTSFKFLKATGLIEDYKRRIDDSIIDVERAQRRIGTMNSIATGMREPLIIAVVVTGIFIQVQGFGGSLGSIILSLLFFYRGLTFLVAVQNNYNNFLGNMGSIENMEDFVADLEAHQENNGSIPVNELREQLVVDDLTYGYESTDILKDLSIIVNKNETLGVVGASGTGKTTLVNVMCGLLKAPEGTFYVDGVDSSQIDMLTYRNRIGYVTQEAQVFTDSIFNNVSFWEDRSPATEAKVWNALELAHAAEFVRELPDQLDTIVGINGVNLSGGQRQRLSISRELFRDIDILVLDEATSALDSQSENLIQENIDSLAGSYTMIVIAHRLATIRNADKILYLKPGGEYEIGTFKSLCNTSKTFQNMVSLQSVG